MEFSFLNMQKLARGARFFIRLDLVLRFAWGGGAPVLGNHIFVGAGAKIIGSIKIGDNCKIGANACVYRDVPANCTVVGNPMRIIQRKPLDNDIC